MSGARSTRAPAALCGAEVEAQYKRFPPTRYQGSKRRFAMGILRALEGLSYATVLDAFGGTGAVSYAFKCAGKAVTCNDLLAFNHQIGRALIENHAERIDADAIHGIGARRPGADYDGFIEETFRGIYYTDEENRWLDSAVVNVHAIAHPHRRALTWFAVLQAAIAKRPFNLFHRRNLYLRTADVHRGFGNKASWDRSFDDHVARFTQQANRCVFDSGVPCRALCGDALGVGGAFDLVYIDPPYISDRGVSVDYRDFYHFLEGLVTYEHWGGAIDEASPHRRLQPIPNPWSRPATCVEQYRLLFRRFGDGILVLSYRDDGIPSIDELVGLMQEVKPLVRVVEIGRGPYALSHRRHTRHVLIIGSR
jgi:16S rRNA G966 N2-methylase RsmD